MKARDLIEVVAAFGCLREEFRPLLLRFRRALGVMNSAERCGQLAVLWLDVALRGCMYSCFCRVFGGLVCTGHYCSHFPPKWGERQGVETSGEACIPKFATSRHRDRNSTTDCGRQTATASSPQPCPIMAPPKAKKGGEGKKNETARMITRDFVYSLSSCSLNSDCSTSSPLDRSSGVVRGG